MTLCADEPTVEAAGPGTWRLRNAHRWLPEARNFAAAVGAEGVNLYHSRPGAECLPHAEPYPLLVVQVAGSKRWTLPDRVIELTPGDVLFLAERVTHRTEALTGSVHFTFRWSLKAPSSAR